MFLNAPATVLIAFFWVNLKQDRILLRKDRREAAQGNAAERISVSPYRPSDRLMQGMRVHD